ncbi:hypothetical protein YC2023_020601 [Brassica napus]
MGCESDSGFFSLMKVLLMFAHRKLKSGIQILLRGNTLDQHNQSLLPHLHKMCYKGVLKYPGSRTEEPSS